MDGHFPYAYEYDPDRVASALAGILDLKVREKAGFELGQYDAPARPPVLCPGCPHRSTFHAVSLVSKQLGSKVNLIYPNDIGCYTLGVQKPFFAADYLLCMGSSTGTACGFSASTDQTPISFVGDSTFFHAAIPGLINAVHNGHRFLLVVLDNRTTAMTGDQPNPGVPTRGMGESAPEVSIEEVVRATGVGFVRTVDPYDEKATMLAVKEALKHEGVSVVISRRECVLLKSSQAKAGQARGEEARVTYEVNQEKCIRCGNCIENFACPAFYTDTAGMILVDQSLCNECGVCLDRLVCPPRAIERR
jgi:indolepyruvate ferredoxin oxidoreductase alpha subunit